MIDKIEKFSCPTLKVEEAKFEDVIPSFKKDMLYLDPPYFLPGDRENNKMHAGIYPMKNFPVHHNDFDHENLRDLLHSHEGPFVLSYNDCTEVRKWYSDFEFYYPEWHYSLGQGEVRVGENRKNTTENIGINNPDLSIFQKYVEKGLKNNKLIYEDKLIQCFFPGPQHSPPYVWSDNIKKVDNIKTVRHSKVHFLVIPKKRIFNIISLKKKHIPLLKYMNKIGIMIAKIILRADNFKQCPQNKFKDDWCSFPAMNKKELVKTYNLLTNNIKCYDTSYS